MCMCIAIGVYFVFACVLCVLYIHAHIMCVCICIYRCVHVWIYVCRGVVCVYVHVSVGRLTMS